MVKIELLIPLAYFGIVCTSSTETVKIAGFFFFLLLIVPNMITMRPTDIKTIPIRSTHLCT